MMDPIILAVANRYSKFASSVSPDLAAQALAAKEALKGYIEFLKGKNREALGLNQALRGIENQVDARIEEINRVLKKFLEKAIEAKPSMGPLKDWDDSQLFLTHGGYIDCFIDPDNLPHPEVSDQLATLRDALKEVRTKAARTTEPNKHYRVECSSCHTVVTQCRCTGPKTTISTTCDRCKEFGR